jgi:DNA-binding response OmpR family regulator
VPNEIGVVSGTVKVLLVDDDPQIRRLLVTLLNRHGSFHVMTAASGEEALNLSRNHSEEIDILITDFEMGSMSGLELSRHIRDQRPETAVLFISATADRVRELLPECPVLQKPFSPRQFLARLAELLSTSRAVRRAGSL